MLNCLAASFIVTSFESTLLMKFSRVSWLITEYFFKFLLCDLFYLLVESAD